MSKCVLIARSPRCITSRHDEAPTSCLLVCLIVCLHFFVDDVLHPFVFLVVGDYYRKLNDLVKVQDEVDDHDGPVKDEGRDESQRYDECPHSYGIADEAELRVAACREDSAYRSGINRSA